MASQLVVASFLSDLYGLPLETVFREPRGELAYEEPTRGARARG